MLAGGKYGKSGVLFANFNQDFTCISVGTPEGFKIFNSEPYQLCYSQSNGGVGLIEMLFSTSLVAIVGSGEGGSSQRRLLINNIKTNLTICDLNFVTAILAVKLNRKRLIVVMETKIHIYDINNMKLLETRDVDPNPKGLCALSPQTTNFMVYPASQNKGNILVMDVLTLETVNLIQAHKGPISQLVLNQNGTMLATASEKGTVIRVYLLPNANKSISFRRGTYPAIIHSITFSNDSKYLCVCSDNGTIHIFKIDFSANANTSSLGAMSSYLPGVISQVWEPSRDFAHIKIQAGIPSICALSQDNKTALVLMGDGLYLQYQFDEQVGGELKLSQEYSLLREPQLDEEKTTLFLHQQPTNKQNINNNNNNNNSNSNSNNNSPTTTTNKEAQLNNINSQNINNNNNSIQQTTNGTN
ncbi:autophagy protein 18 [Heterostelium album PN500]|uniref:Autophagy protein 18 n=1 Tax=Heterostelium pallidum (strain ATCC 26659 / Pp 5 / PN500) TaxID=670386 RepID=D3BI43_HETP5|nr:autophagy protein 18 [Heterostelium album PN500]EFA78943.1 autophagy protein 18 [Heterostelium album PN500]|eukprot:XP_020431067.1 autophagy protein 18 [Heterostelium album PN500]